MSGIYDARTQGTAVIKQGLCVCRFGASRQAQLSWLVNKDTRVLTRTITLFSMQLIPKRVVVKTGVGLRRICLQPRMIKQNDEARIGDFAKKRAPIGSAKDPRILQSTWILERRYPVEWKASC